MKGDYYRNGRKNIFSFALQLKTLILLQLPFSPLKSFNHN